MERRLVVLDRQHVVGPGVADRRGLHDFGKPGGAVPQWERAQRGDVDPDEARLMEGAHQILALRQVDGDLAPDARVDHREHGGRHLHESYAT